jgi:hypothetical protein
VKYTNQINALLAVIGFGVVIYALAGTFMAPPPDLGRIELPRVQTAAPVQRPITRPPVPVPPPTAGSRISAPAEAEAVTGAEEPPADLGQPVPQALFPPSQPPQSGARPTINQEGPRSITIQGQTESPRPAQPRPRTDQQRGAAPQFFPQRQGDRPAPPPQDPNAVKRQPGDGVTPPPVRSSMPEQNPPR